MTKIRDESYKITHAHGLGLMSHTTARGNWTDGGVVTKFGIVDIYIDEERARMDFVCRGRHHIRSVSKAVTKRGIVTMANRFAMQISSGKNSSNKEESK